MPAFPPPSPLARRLSRGVLALFFVAAGANHFRSPGLYLGMMPAWVAWPHAANVVSGLGEVLGGIGLLVPATRAAAGWGLILLLVAVFPANLHVALLGHMPGFSFSPATLWIRLPFQGVLMAWVAWAAIVGGGGRPRQPPPGAARGAGRRRGSAAGPQ
jgi:uncharacterized membrane protein